MRRLLKSCLLSRLFESLYRLAAQCSRHQSRCGAQEGADPPLLTRRNLWTEQEVFALACPRRHDRVLLVGAFLSESGQVISATSALLN